MTLVPGLNLEGVIVKSPNLNLGGDSDMKEERTSKKKKPKYDFDHLFPKPKGEKNMGMSDFGNKDIVFEGLI